MMISLVSPAKINLFLHILRRRADGYHELASLFQAIDLCDTLYFSLSNEDKFTCSDPVLPTDLTNLVVKAVHLFRRKTGLKTAFKIHLDKIIPLEAGLGGGSSNAASTLWACNHLCGGPATEAELAQWGAEIGSDISFFLSLGTAYCTGRGEVIRPLSPLSQTPLCIVKPSQGLSTPQVYGKLNAALLPSRNPEYILEQFLRENPIYFNDLEEPAFALLPELADLKGELLKSGFSTVLMSGSGSSFFCVGQGEISPRLNLKRYYARFVNRSAGEWYLHHK